MLALAPLFLAGCSLSVPMPGSNGEPATTGSIRASVDVQRPLPQSLAYSDAAKIGEAAAAALWQAEAPAGGEWVNAATGSSGTVEQGGVKDGACRPFNTIVTSIGGVHRYSGKICLERNGRSMVQIEAPSEDASS